MKTGLALLALALAACTPPSSTSGTSRTTTAVAEATTATPGEPAAPVVELEQDCAIDPVAIKATLIRHAGYEFGFNAKFGGQAHSIDPRLGRIGYHEVSELAQRLEALTPEELTRRVTERLQLLSNDPRGPDVATGALIYDFSRDVNTRFAHACVWLFDGQGLVAAEKVPLGAQSPAATIATAMGISRRAARMAQPRNGPAPAPITEEEAHRFRASVTPALRSASAQFLPPSIAAGIQSRRLQRLLILPAIDFGTVPFAALPISSQAVLGDVAAIVVLPQVSTLLEHSRDTIFAFEWPQNPQRVVVVGNPDLRDDPEYLWADLPAAQEEAEFVARELGAAALTGGEATERNFYRRLGMGGGGTPVRLLYFATHGMTDPEHPFTNSYLALSGGRLLGDDVKRMVLFAHPLVVLSACQTANGRVFEGGGYGLVRSWYYSGAGQVVGSLWNVDDAATSRLMRRFMTALKRDPRPEFAMQDAMRGAEATDRADPALWAAFIVFGNPSFDHPQARRDRY
jgi:hypothetical protein